MSWAKALLTNSTTDSMEPEVPTHTPGTPVDGTTTPPVPQPDAEAGPSTTIRQSVIDKWLNPAGPPKGTSFGARKLQESDDVFSNNAW